MYINMFLRYIAGPYSEPAESSLLHHILYSDTHFLLTSSRLDFYLTSGLPFSVFGLIFCAFFVLLVPCIFVYSVCWPTNALHNIQRNVIYDKYRHVSTLEYHLQGVYEHKESQVQHSASGIIALTDIFKILKC
jgi:hypothetical protein